MAGVIDDTGRERIADAASRVRSGDEIRGQVLDPATNAADALTGLRAWAELLEEAAELVRSVSVTYSRPLPLVR